MTKPPPPPKKKLTKEEIAEIMKIISECYEEIGREIETAIVVDDGETDVLIDKREEKDLH